jgi:hypothetical protein
MREFDTLGRTGFLEKYGFGKSREYMLREVETGNLYDSKAIVGAAYGYAFPEEGPLGPEDFSGGEATVERVLASLEFEVVRTGQDWSAGEVLLAVQDYFKMLAMESQSTPYNKAEHNERLRSRLKVRSKSSIELKHQNISAVLDQLGLPYIKGYKPRSNLQQLLRQTVLEHVENYRKDLTKILDNLEAQTTPGNAKYRGVLVAPPEVDSVPSVSRRIRLPRKLDYAARDESNRKLGYNGEHWVVGYEETRLNDEGRTDLVTKIDWVSDRLGDGSGYDVLSYEVSEEKRFIEVKTTNGGPLTPFVVSRNELEFSEESRDSYYLYRLFDFGTQPRLYILRGELSARLALEPIDYRARLKAVS